jgi:hypothetical protein
MSKPRFPKEVIEKAKAVTGKRARLVVEHILKHGSITTEDLERIGYKHPPRGAQDVKDQGVPLEGFWTKNSSGRRIKGYTFGGAEGIRRLAGRKAFSKKFRAEVCAAHQSRCGICRTTFEPRYLQLDHRIPYQVAGDLATREPGEYMPLCGSCNRAKSWSCEHCPNWLRKELSVCATCYWASPEDYDHVAMRRMRRLDVVWEGKEVADFEAVAGAAEAREQAIPEFVKRVLRRAIGRETE